MSHDHTDTHQALGGHPGRAVRLGVGGPVGSGKTALVAALCLVLRDELALAVVTNDIYTTEDADFLRRAGVLDDDRIRAVRPGAARTPRSVTTSRPTWRRPRTWSTGTRHWTC